MESDNNMSLDNSSHENDFAVKDKKAKKRGILFILSGPSGVGKGTLRKAIMDLGGINFSVSCTTRPPREGEIDGVDYRFLSPEEFNKRLSESLFLEHALVHDNMYGTLRKDVENVLESGEDMVLEIDVQGAFQVKSKMDCISVFILPPSVKALEYRLCKRGSDNDVKLRLKNAEYEMSHSEEFDYRIVNDSLNQAIAELKNIIINCRNMSRGL